MNKTSLDDVLQEGKSFDFQFNFFMGEEPSIIHAQQKDYFKWEKKALMVLLSEYPDHPQTKSFQCIVDADKRRALSSTFNSLLGIVNAFCEIRPTNSNKDADILLADIFNNFQRFVNQLKRNRHNKRENFVNDEYDVQDLLHAVLKLHFDDVRPEVWTPQYAGSSNRMDFFINDSQTAIEVKYSKNNHIEKQIGDELLIDLTKYSEYPNCKSLYCFIYDPGYCISNPKGLENDLNNKSTDSFKVKVFVRPLE